MKSSLVLLALIATLAAPAARAATLNEINGPLLNKNQWELNAAATISYYTDKSRQNTVGGVGSKADSAATQVSLSPAASYGLTDKLTLLVQEFYGIPYTSAYKHYLVPGGPDSSIKLESKGRNMLSSSLTWRPSDPWQFLFTGSQDYLGLDREMTALPASGITNSMGQQNHSTNLTAQASWLSRPKAGPMTANNRADLDGLLNPLLNQSQAEAVLGFTYFRGYAHANMAQLNGPSSRLQSARTTAEQLSASPYFLYGILENLQAQAAVDLTIPNATDSLARTRSVDTNSIGVVSSRSSRTKGRTLAGYSPRVSLTHRLNRQLQWFVSGNYNYSKSSQSGVTVNENTGAISTDSGVSGFENASVGAGADWISAPRGEGRALAADLDGRKRPLLERNQFWATVSYSTSKQRYWTVGMPSQSGPTSSTYYSKLSYGVRDALQAFASLQIVPGYSEKNGTFSKSTYPAIKTYGAGLTWRPRQTFQASAETSIAQRVSKAENYDPGGAVTSTSKTESATYTAYLSATWLW